MLDVPIDSCELARQLKRIEQKLCYHRREQHTLECLAARIEYILIERAQRALLVVELHADDYIIYINQQ